jgi:acyl-coenzyme A thioesterase PaaI-like protein
VPALPGLEVPDGALPAERSALAPPPGAALQHYPGCYACGEEHPHGLHLRAVAGEGASVSAQLTITTAHQGAPGLAHGGVVAAVFDDLLGFVPVLMGRIAVTARLETSYRAPIPVGSTLHWSAAGTGVVGRKIFTHGQARLGEPDGPLAAEAAALFVQVPAEHFAAGLGVTTAAGRERLAEMARGAGFGVAP